MRVLHVIPSVDWENGGPTTALLGLTAAQVRAGMTVDVLTTYRSSSSGAMMRPFNVRGVQVRMIGPVRGKLARHPDLAAAAEQSVANADIVHIHALWEEVLHDAARAAQRRKIPYIVRTCGMLDPWCLKRRWLAKKMILAWRVRENLDRAAALHFTSEGEMEGAERLGLKPEPILEPNGIDLREFKTLPKRGTFSSLFPQVLGRRILLFLSRLHPKKGLDLLIPAFAKVAGMSGMSDWMLVLSGPSSNGYVDTVRQMIHRHRLEERVLVTGMLSDQQRIAALTDASLFALPSRQENFGIAVLEALAAAAPVIVSDQVDIHTDITASAAGQVVPVSEPALASALREWMSDESRRQAAGQRGRNFALKHYNWAAIADRWERHYGRLVH